MDYEKLHKDTIAKLQEMVNSGKITVETARGICADFVPESEDEKIRKAIEYAIGQSTHSDGTLINGVSSEEAIAWLEKQGEHVKFLNSIQVGDQITRNEDGELFNLSQLKRVAKPAENKGKSNMGISEATKQKLEDNLNKALEKETPESWNEFLDEQKSAEHKEIPTDIRSIVDKEANAIWEEINTGHNHSIIDTFNQFYGICMQIAEAVMEYNKPVEWSEEDERMFGNCIYAVGGYYYLPEDRQSMKDFLKSLKERYTWKPSDEQMEVLVWCKPLFADPKLKGILESLINDLKKLREE